MLKWQERASKQEHSCWHGHGFLWHDIQMRRCSRIVDGEEEAVVW